MVLLNTFTACSAIVRHGMMVASLIASEHDQTCTCVYLFGANARILLGSTILQFCC